jgi:hypothetical protein
VCQPGERLGRDRGKGGKPREADVQQDDPRDLTHLHARCQRSAARDTKIAHEAVDGWRTGGHGTTVSSDGAERECSGLVGQRRCRDQAGRHEWSRPLPTATVPEVTAHHGQWYVRHQVCQLEVGWGRAVGKAKGSV